MSATASRKALQFATVATFGVPLVVFWRTAYPSITWWDGSSYPLAAATLGITSAPGSLLLTLLGWPITQLTSGAPVRALNIFAGALAATTITLLFVVTLRLARTSGEPNTDSGNATILGAALGALTFAFTPTLWEHATKFTPYIL